MVGERERDVSIPQYGSPRVALDFPALRSTPGTSAPNDPIPTRPSFSISALDVSLTMRNSDMEWGGEGKMS